MVNKMSSDNKDKTDDSLEYKKYLEALAGESTKGHHAESSDPLAEVKDMRLQELAACRIKTAKELQDKMSKTEDDQ